MPFDQTGKPAILRPLGGIEKLFWLISQNRQTHFAITAEVAGSSQVAQWQEALDRICGQLPVIWSRIVSDSRGVPLFEVVPRGSIPLQVVEDAGSNWATHVAAQIERPFDPSEAPLLEAVRRCQALTSSTTKRFRRLARMETKAISMKATRCSLVLSKMMFNRR